MEEKELKTSTRQRVIIGLIALVMVGTMIASYAAIVINGNKSTSVTTETEKLSDERMAYYEEQYEEKLKEFQTASAGDYQKFVQYVSEASDYDETTANANGVTSRNLLSGSGREVVENDADYLAYYMGWCADGSVFDSSLDSVKEPTAFSKALDVSIGMISGWTKGVVGMRLGGVREITMPGSEAYGEQMEICGGYNKPLRFLVLAVAKEEPLKTAQANLDQAFMGLQYANYGIDYEKLSNKSTD